MTRTSEIKRIKSAAVQEFSFCITFRMTIVYSIYKFWSEIHTSSTCIDNKIKVNVKFTLEQATKAQRGSRGIALLFL
jgi:hypothetical protein